MEPTRRRLLGGASLVFPLAGCIRDPGPDCPGATIGLSLSPADSVENPLELDPESLSTEANAVVETAIEGEHVERCVSWNPDDDETGPSPGLRAVGDRIAAHTGIELAGRTEDVRIDASRDGDTYRLTLRIDAERR